MPYTNENTSNTSEDKNTIKSRTYFHCGPHHKTSGHHKTLTECAIINKKTTYVLKQSHKQSLSVTPYTP